MNRSKSFRKNNAKVKSGLKPDHHRLYLANKQIKIAIIIIFVLAGALGVHSIYGSHAATLVTSAEAENGALAGSAAAISDSAASGGSAVRFSIPSSSSPCGQNISPPNIYDHVIWINFENLSYTQIINNSNLTYTHSLISKCGSASKMYSAHDPSLPNYIAEVSGGDQGITDDGAPSQHPLAADNLFNEVKQAGKQWRTYAESMPSNCYKKDSPPAPNALYTVHHEAAVYFTDLAADCPNWDVPLGTATSGKFINDLNNNTLPAFAIIGPNDDGGNSTAGGDVDPQKLDGFLKTWVGMIINSNIYHQGRTAIFITWDENSTFKQFSPNCVPTNQATCLNNVAWIAIAPTIPAGFQSGTFYTFYSMLRSTEEMLGITKMLGAAANSPDMRSTFHM